MFEKETLDGLYEPFATLDQRKGAGGNFYKFVPTEDVLDRMNKVFGGAWSTEVLSKEIIDDQVIILVRVLVNDPSTGVLVYHEGYGSHQIARYSGGQNVGKAINYGNDFKSAVSKAIKTACTRWGVGLYLEKVSATSEPVSPSATHNPVSTITNTSGPPAISKSGPPGMNNQGPSNPIQEPEVPVINNPDPPAINNGPPGMNKTEPVVVNTAGPVVVNNGPPGMNKTEPVVINNPDPPATNNGPPAMNSAAPVVTNNSDPSDMNNGPPNPTQHATNTTNVNSLVDNIPANTTSFVVPAEEGGKLTDVQKVAIETILAGNNIDFPTLLGLVFENPDYVSSVDSLDYTDAVKVIQKGNVVARAAKGGY